MSETTQPARDQGKGWSVASRRSLLLDLAGFVAGVILGLIFLGAFFRGHFLIALLALYVASRLGTRLQARHDRERLRPRLVAGALLLPTRAGNPALACIFCVMAPLFLVGSAAEFAASLGQPHHLWTPGLVLGLLLGEAIGVLSLLGAYAALRALLVKDRGLLLAPDAVTINTAGTPVDLSWVELSTPNPLGSVLDSPHALAALTYYLDHPESRDELGTERALARVESLARDEG